MSEEKNQERGKSTNELTKKQIILYSAVIAVTITICILAMIGVNLFALLIIIGIVIIYVFLDEDIRKGDISNSINDNNDNKKE